MAAFTVARSKHFNLTGVTADSVAITGGCAAVEILNRGAVDVSFTVSNGALVAPTVLGDDTHLVLAGRELTIPVSTDGPGRTQNVGLIAPAAVAVSVTGIQG